MLVKMPNSKDNILKENSNSKSLLKEPLLKKSDLVVLASLLSTLRLELELWSKRVDSRSNTKGSWSTEKDKSRFIRNRKTCANSKEKNTFKKKPFLVISRWLRPKKLTHAETCTLTKPQETLTLTWLLQPTRLLQKCNKLSNQEKSIHNSFILLAFMLIKFSSQIPIAHGPKKESRKEPSPNKRHRLKPILPKKEDLKL